MIKPQNTNTEFELGGINHVALVCADMQRTVDFYSGVLGMPLIKSLDLPGGMGQHFFFDAGGGRAWRSSGSRRRPTGCPGVLTGRAAGPRRDRQRGVDHEPSGVPCAGGELRLLPAKLKDKGVRVGPVLNHDESPMQVSRELHPGVYVRSFYFNDPDGITLEFACWTKEFGAADTAAVPRTAADRRVPVS